MKTSTNGLNFITKEEGVILQAYDDATDHVVKTGDTIKGTLTIGVGHTTAAGLPKVFVGQKITQEQAEIILAADLSKVEAEINSLVKVPLTQNQFDALVSFQFNTGGLGRSSVLKSLNNKDYTQAANNLLLWSKGNNNPTLLLGRRTREKTLFLTKDSTNATSTSIVSVLAAGTVAGAGAIATTSVHPYAPYLAAGLVATAAIGGLTYWWNQSKANV